MALFVGLWNGYYAVSRREGGLSKLRAAINATKLAMAAMRDNNK